MGSTGGAPCWRPGANRSKTCAECDVPVACGLPVGRRRATGRRAIAAAAACSWRSCSEPLGGWRSPSQVRRVLTKGREVATRGPTRRCRCRCCGCAACRAEAEPAAGRYARLWEFCDIRLVRALQPHQGRGVRGHGGFPRTAGAPRPAGVVGAVPRPSMPVSGCATRRTSPATPTPRRRAATTTRAAS